MSQSDRKRITGTLSAQNDKPNAELDINKYDLGLVVFFSEKNMRALDDHKQGQYKMNVNNKGYSLWNWSGFV